MDKKRAELVERRRELSAVHELQRSQLAEQHDAEERGLIEQQGREISELYGPAGQRERDLEERERELNKRHQLEWDLIAEQEREIIERQRREISELYEPQEADEPCMCAVEGIDEATWAQIARDKQKGVDDNERPCDKAGERWCVPGDEARARLNYDEAILIVRRFQTNVTTGVQLVTDVVWDYSDVWEYQDVVQYVRIQHNRVKVRPDLSVPGEEYRAAEELHKSWAKYSALFREEP